MCLGQQDSLAECGESALVPWTVCGPIIGTLILFFISIFFILLRGDLSSILDEGLNIKAPKQNEKPNSLDFILGFTSAVDEESL